jgi:alpha-ribazole phosphatase
MKRIFCIRHAKTQGNLEKRYIGTTDEELSATGIEELTRNKEQYPDVDIVFSSPMKRCIQTARLLYELKKIHIVSALRECDFGIFENKNYEELKDNPQYQAWIDSYDRNNTSFGKGGKTDIPDEENSIPYGENAGQFKKRCCEAFESIIDTMESKNVETAAIVAHGGTFMAILEKYSPEGQSFFRWQLGNGDMLELSVDGRRIVNIISVPIQR